MNRQFRSAVAASPAALGAIALMPTGCLRCPVLRAGNCRTFNEAAGDAPTRDEALALVAAQEKPADPDHEVCGDQPENRNS